MVKTAILETPKGREIEVKEYNPAVHFQNMRTARGKIELTAPEYGFNALKWILDEIEVARKHEWDRNIVLSGGEGDGKSTAAAHIATRIGLSDPHKVAYNPADYLKHLEGSDFLDITWLDEGTQGLYTRNAMTSQNKKINQAFAFFRAKKLTNVICIPHTHLLDKDIRNRRVHYWGSVETQGYRRGYIYWYMAGKKRRWLNSDDMSNRVPKTYNRWDISCFWEPMFLMRFPQFEEHNGFEWDEYKYDVKMPALNRFLEKCRIEAEDAEKKSSTGAGRLVNAVHAMHENGMDKKEIAKELGYTTDRQVRRYLKRDPVEG